MFSGIKNDRIVIEAVAIHARDHPCSQGSKPPSVRSSIYLLIRIKSHSTLWARPAPLSCHSINLYIQAGACWPFSPLPHLPPTTGTHRIWQHSSYVLLCIVSLRRCWCHRPPISPHCNNRNIHFDWFTPDTTIPICTVA